MNERVRKVLLLCLCLIVGLATTSSSYSLVFSAVPWKIKYSKYRLFYWINMSQVVDPTNFKVIVKIPTTIIDDMLRYCEDHLYNNTTFGYRFCSYAWPRVYYIDNLATYNQRQVLYVVNATYKGVPQVITIYFDSTTNPLNTSQTEQWLVVYFPYYVWEDFEDLPYNLVLSNVGECYPDGWCVKTVGNNRHAVIEVGYDPTPKKSLHIHSWGWGGKIGICKDVNIPIIASKFYNTTVEWYWTVTNYNSPAGASVYFTFNLSDGTQKTIAYYMQGYGAYYIFSRCNSVNIPLPKGWVKRNVLHDLYAYCLAGLYNLSDVVSLYRICFGVYNSNWDWSAMGIRVDNIRIIPSDIENYFAPIS